jgi:phage/plasmid-like protein (TIGR03299 family)
MAYANEVPWHGLGVKVSEKMTPEQMLKAAGLDWTVSKQPIFRKVNGKVEAIDGQFALCRDSDNAFLDIVGSTWKEFQNKDGMEFFKKWVKAAKMTLETAGSFWGGKYVWVLAKIGKDFDVGPKGKSDKVESYVLFAIPHQHGKAVLALHTLVRVVCWNTLNAALGGSWRSAGKREGVFRMPHSCHWNEDMKAKAEQTLGLAIAQTEEFEQAARLLSKKKVGKPEKVDEYFFEVLKFDPKKGTKKKDGSVREPLMLPKFRQALISAPGAAEAEGTWWGALNAVTYVIDHQSGRERDTALKNAWLGHLAGVKRRAFSLAIDYAS